MLNDFLERLLPWKTRPSSREEVKQRLKLVLAYDRAGISPGMLNAMRDDIVAVLSRYVEIDDEQLQFSIENSDRATALIANFPIRRIKNTSQPEPESSASEEESAPTSSEDVEVAEVSAPELEDLFIEDAPLDSPQVPPDSASPPEREDKDELPGSTASEPQEFPEKSDISAKSSQKSRKTPKTE